MDYDFAIERHRGSLLSLVLTLFAEIGLAEGGTVERVSKPVYRDLLGFLRKAESAARRLIYIAARNIVVELDEARPSRPRQKASAESKAEDTGRNRTKRKRRPLFKLFDPARRLKKFFGRRPKRKRVEPRIHFFDFDPRIPSFLRQPPAAPAAPAPVEEEIVDDGMVDARKLIRRFLALTEALQDIPRQAMRLALWRSRPVEERRPERSSPLRIGRPPGYRQRSIHEVDDILKECDWLARNVEPPLDDTS